MLCRLLTFGLLLSDPLLLIELLHKRGLGLFGNAAVVFVVAEIEAAVTGIYLRHAAFFYGCGFVNGKTHWDVSKRFNAVRFFLFSNKVFWLSTISSAMHNKTDGQIIRIDGCADI